MAHQKEKATPLDAWRKFTTHHRKPRSIGGETRDANLRRIPHAIHGAWHEVVAHMCAPKIVMLLNTLCSDATIAYERHEWPLYEHGCPKTRLCPSVCFTLKPDGTRWLEGPLARIKRENAWKRLYYLIGEYVGEHSLTAVIDYINYALIDPDFLLVLAETKDSNCR